MKRPPRRRYLPIAACGAAAIGLGALACEHGWGGVAALAGWSPSLVPRIDWPSGLEIRIRVLHEPR